MIQRSKHIHQIKMQHSIELQYGMGHKKVELPDDISFHGSLFHSFHSVPELIFAFWTMIMKVKNKNSQNMKYQGNIIK